MQSVGASDRRSGLRKLKCIRFGELRAFAVAVVLLVMLRAPVVNGMRHRSQARPLCQAERAVAKALGPA